MNDDYYDDDYMQDPDTVPVMSYREARHRASFRLTVMYGAALIAEIVTIVLLFVQEPTRSAVYLGLAMGYLFPATGRELATNYYQWRSTR